MGMREIPKPITQARRILEYNGTLELFCTRPLKMWVCVDLVRGEGVVGLEGGRVRTSDDSNFIILLYLQGHPCCWALFHVP